MKIIKHISGYLLTLILVQRSVFDFQASLLKSAVDHAMRGLLNLSHTYKREHGEDTSWPGYKAAKHKLQCRLRQLSK